jgi:hypothetical protein
MGVILRGKTLCLPASPQPGLKRAWDHCGMFFVEKHSGVLNVIESICLVNQVLIIAE